MKYRYFFILLWVMILPTEIFAKANYLRGAKLTENGLEITFKFPVKKVKHFLIANNGYTKHIYDITGGVLPPNQKLPFKHKNVKSFRIGQYNKSTLRIVIETTKGQGEKYSISSRVLTIPLPKGKRFVSRTKKKKNRTNILKDSRKSVVIDAGHGGRDNGASDFGVYEKKLTLKMAYKVKKRLEKMGYKVYMTRTKDRYVSLLERTQYANRKGANIFVSIHVNASPKHKRNRLNGIETYYLSSSNVHQSNNQIIYKGGRAVYKNALYRQMISPKKRSYSRYLAKKVEKQISRNIRRSYGPVVSKLKNSDFWVLTGTKIPSILIETGYVTHKKDRRRLTNNHYQNLIAKGIAEGINGYFYGSK